MYGEYRSRMWYLVPIFLGILGGVISWFALRNSDRALAKNCLIVGVISSLLSLILSLLMGASLVQEAPESVYWNE